MTEVRPGAFMLSLIPLDRAAATPLYRQIYRGIRRAVLGRKLPPGTRLPSTRELAALLDVSRNTVVNAFDQLGAEGYLETRVGAGTFVNSRLPEAFLRVEPREPPAVAEAGARTLSRRGRAAARPFSGEMPQAEHAAFALNRPELDAFPLKVWARLAARRYRQLEPAALGYYQHPAGYPPLREAIATHLWAARGVRCSAEQIVIVAGSQPGLHLAGQVLLDPGDAVWVEDPGYVGARNALQVGGARLAPVPVDDQGLVVAVGQDECPQARAVYVTPSHQFPLGHTMSLARRLELLQWAAENDGWIIEDDYDSDYRYGGAPIASLQGLDRQRRVVYVGTFSKTIFPQLRLGYVVAPADLVGAFVGARAAINFSPPLLPQMVLADFIAGGHFLRHLRRMRRRYEARRDALLQALRAVLGDWLEPGPADAGIHLTAWLPPGVEDGPLWQRAAEHGVSVRPLSWMYARQPARSGLILGFGSAAPEEIWSGARRLAQALT